MANFIPVRLAYNIIKPKNSDPILPPLLFLHGVTQSKEAWHDIPQKVANEVGRKAYVIDARNHGDSEWSEDFNFDITVKDLFQFMDSKNIDRAILIGHSMGGITVIKAALQKPERVEKVIVEDMFVKKLPKSIVDMIVWYAFMAQKSIKSVSPNATEEEAVKYILDQVHKELPVNLRVQVKNEYSDKHVLKLKRDSNGDYTFKGNLEAIRRGLMNYETCMSESSGCYEGPACFIYGELSPNHVGDEKNHIKQYFPNACFVEIKDATHSIHVDKPKEFTAAVLDFLN